MYSQHQLQLTNFRDGHFPDNSRHCQPDHPHITWPRQVQHDTCFIPYRAVSSAGVSAPTISTSFTDEIG